MKNLPRILALAFFALALTGAALAEDNAHVVRANIPFDFYAGGQLLPAGEYTILVNVEGDMVTMQQASGSSSLFLLGSADDSSRDGRIVLTFKRARGEVYALRELQSPGWGVSFNAGKPRHTMRAQSRESQSVEVIAEAR